MYKKLGLRAEGFDFSETAYQYASSHYQTAGMVLHQKPPKPCQQFDYVAACEVLEHCRDDVRMLRHWKNDCFCAGT